MMGGKSKVRGFTLVELAIVLVIIGIIIGAILKGTELINNSRAKRVQNDLRGIEAAMWTFYDRFGRFPGDYGPTNGVIKYGLGATSPVYDGDAPNSADPDAPWNELKYQQILPGSAPNPTLAKHVFNGYFAIGHYNNGTDGFNAIAVYDIPTFAATMIDVSIDGGGTPNTGRVRNFTGGSIQTSWPANPNQKVTLIYFIDALP